MIEFIQQNAPSIATIFFFLFFCSVVYSVFKKGQEKKFDEYSKIPMRDKERRNKNPNLISKNSSKKDQETKHKKK